MRVNKRDGLVITGKPLYPRLMITSSKDVIILVIDYEDGVVIWSDSKDYKLGKSVCWDMDDLVDYNGTISLSNNDDDFDSSN